MIGVDGGCIKKNKQTIIIIIITIENKLKQVELFPSLLSYATNSYVCPFHAVASESGCIEKYKGTDVLVFLVKSIVLWG